ncbi:hypothetical protein [Streptomyces sp. 029-5]|uniref:hypothetical protein n=1 Tax=Streptomyces sp. 029-5 TaxID=2789261 RepID=UPI0039817B09
MVSGNERYGIGPVGRMSSGEGRRFLPRPTGAFGVGGAVLVAEADEGGPESGDLPPGDGMKWPTCQCGGPQCPVMVVRAE